MRKLVAKRLGYLSGPEAANPNGSSRHAIINQPIPGMEPAVAAEAATLKSNRKYIRKPLNDAQLFGNFLLFSFGKRKKQISHRVCPDDLGFHFFLLVRTRDILKTSL